MECVTQKGLVGDTNTLNRGGELKERKTAQREDREKGQHKLRREYQDPQPGPCDPEHFPKSSVPFSQLLQRVCSHAVAAITAASPHPEGFQPRLVLPETLQCELP